jgi:primosomal protein N' (replication factor Y)
VIDSKPIVNPTQFTFWEWISEYYMCFTGEVMHAALPSAFRLASESRLRLKPGFEAGRVSLGEKEAILAEALIHRDSITIKEASDLTDQLKVLPLVNTLIEKQVIILEEELRDQYRPKQETFARLAPACRNEKALQEIFEKLEKRAFKQLQLLLVYLQMKGAGDAFPEVKKTLLLEKAEASHAQFNELVKKGVFEVVTKNVSRLETEEASRKAGSIVYNGHQEKALSEIKDILQEKNVCLLHGVTSSGKTEIYIRLIQESLDRGKQVLYLLPEIALTTQIINRLQKFFGDQVGVYHSRYNERERVEIWQKVLGTEAGKQYNIILGARSAVFLPFSRLGLVIVDEEHDQSYKQIDPAPRYNARDAAVYLAGLHGAKTLMGTATPSFESYYNTRSGKFGLVELSKRYLDLQMPEIMIADLRKEGRSKNRDSHFSRMLLEHIDEALANKEQVILFQNRRGFSPRLECEVCSWIPMCTRCDISLTYHKKADHLRCHYCGYHTRVPPVCGHCGSSRLIMRGFGTEKVEEEIALIYPDASIRRMDLDTTRRKHGHQKIIYAFEKQEIDILVGTQMITKGLDFDHVSVVGILNADNMLNFPDFRSFERSFQLMSQVAGRAGRKKKRGKVIIQTYHPAHEVIRDVMDNDYKRLFRAGMVDRNRYHYPPYYRLVQVRLLNRDYRLLNEAAEVLGIQLSKVFPGKVLGPEYPLVSRVKDQYIKQVLIKASRTESVVALKKELGYQLDDFASLKEFKKIRIRVDVDPY